jgi:Mannosyl-glycoprotein endo-beta-N-acetylglucosaminidase/LysM domain
MRLKRMPGLLFFLLICGVSVRAQTSTDVQDYIQTYKDLAIAEMQRSGIPASIILAQGIHETEAGTSDLVRKSNNHFGIKCKDNWTGDIVYHDDDARGECFRSYPTAQDSYKDHSDFLRNSPRYAALFNLDPEDYEAWAYGLRKAGYATNIHYPQLLIKLIKDYNLSQYTLIALGKYSGAPAMATVTSPKATNPVHYPEGSFQINATKVIYVKEGTSLLSLAEQYDVPLSKLLEFNDLKDIDILAQDQLVFLQRKRKTGVNAIHLVQPGETLYDICQQEAIRYESVLELNRLVKGEEPAAGEKIYLQSASASKPLLAKEQSPAAGTAAAPASF